MTSSYFEETSTETDSHVLLCMLYSTKHGPKSIGYYMCRVVNLGGKGREKRKRRMKKKQRRMNAT